jgi:hypothetical protein
VKNVRILIESAFADVQYPGDDKITEHKICPECDDLAEHFRGTTWRNHKLSNLRQYQSGLTLFAPAALQFFLPAFMLESLENWRDFDDLPFSILHLCLPSDAEESPELKKHREDRFLIFTQQQREAIANYLTEWKNSGVIVLGEEDITKAIDRLIAK